MAVWIVRAAGDTAKEREALDGGCCIAGWDELRDFRNLPDEGAIRNAIRGLYPAKNNMGVAGWAGQILRFRDAMKPGDIVVMPVGGGRGTLHVGLVEGDYDYSPAVEGGVPRHRRPTRWVGTLRKADVVIEATGTIGAFLTVFLVRKPQFERQLQAIVDGAATPAGRSASAARRP